MLVRIGQRGMALTVKDREDIETAINHITRSVDLLRDLCERVRNSNDGEGIVVSVPLDLTVCDLEHTIAALKMASEPVCNEYNTVEQYQWI